MSEIEPIKLIIDFDDEEDDDQPQCADKQDKEATQKAQESIRKPTPVPSQGKLFFCPEDAFEAIHDDGKKTEKSGKKSNKKSPVEVETGHQTERKPGICGSGGRTKSFENVSIKTSEESQEKNTKKKKEISIKIAESKHEKIERFNKGDYAVNSLFLRYIAENNIADVMARIFEIWLLFDLSDYLTDGTFEEIKKRTGFTDRDILLELFKVTGDSVYFEKTKFGILAEAGIEQCKSSSAVVSIFNILHERSILKDIETADPVVIELTLNAFAENRSDIIGILAKEVEGLCYWIENMNFFELQEKLILPEDSTPLDFFNLYHHCFGAKTYQDNAVA